MGSRPINALQIFFINKSNNSKIHKTIKINLQLNLEKILNVYTNPNTDPQKQQIDNWERKVLHGRHPHDLHGTSVYRFNRIEYVA